MTNPTNPTNPASAGAVEQRDSDARPSGKLRDAVPLCLVYTNWRGETSVRRIVPLGAPYLGGNDWHPWPTWLLPAWDVDKQAEREFALSGFAVAVPPAGTPGLSAAELDGLELDRVQRVIDGKLTCKGGSDVRLVSTYWLERYVTMARVSLRQDDRYRAGLEQALDIAAKHEARSHDPWQVQQDIVGEIAEEAASPAPQPDAGPPSIETLPDGTEIQHQGSPTWLADELAATERDTGPEPVAWQWRYKLANPLGMTKWFDGRFPDHSPLWPDMYKEPEERPLYAAPLAPVPAREVTEAQFEAAKTAWLKQSQGVSRRTSDDCLRAALTVAQPRADAGEVTAEMVEAGRLAYRKQEPGTVDVADILRAALAARGDRS